MRAGRRVVPRSGEFEDRGNEIRHEGESRGDSPRLDARPGEDQRDANPALAAVELVVRERSGRRPREVRADDRVAPLLAERLEIAAVADTLRPARELTALGRVASLRAVVGQHDEDGVLQEPFLTEVLDESTEVVVHRFEHRRVDRHVLRGERLLLRRESIPVRLFGDGRRRRPGGKDTGFDGAAMTLSPQRVPSFVVDALVSLDELPRRLNRQVDRLEGEVGEEGPWLPTRGPVRVDELD